MRKRSSKVSVLNKIKKLSLQKIVLRNAFGGFTYLGFQERMLSSLFKIKEGTIFAVEHHTTSGPRILLEKFKKEGFIGSYGEGPQFSDYPKFYHASVGFNGVEDDLLTKQMSWGFAFLDEPPEAALYKALIESIERHANYFSLNSKTVYYPTISYGDASWLFPLTPHPRPEQLRRIPTLASSPQDLKRVRGFKAKSLFSYKKRFLPLQAFYFGMDLFTEKLLSDSTTSGTGAGSDKDMATLSALYELIERDHFHLYSFANIQPKMIDVSDDEELNVRINEMRQRYNLEVYLFDISYDYDTQVVLSVIVDPVLHIVSCGAKAGQIARSVVKGALLESMAVLNSLRETGGFYSDNETRKILSQKIFLNENIDKHGRMRIFSTPYGISLLRKTLLKDNGEKIPFVEYQKKDKFFKDRHDELAHMILFCKQKMKEKGDGYDMFVHELSSKYSEELKLSIVHIFCPAFLKLHLNEIFSAPISPRLTEFAQIKGKKNFQEKDINPLPHFFP